MRRDIWDNMVGDRSGMVNHRRGGRGSMVVGVDMLWSTAMKMVLEHRRPGHVPRLWGHVWRRGGSRGHEESRRKSRKRTVVVK